MVAPTRLGTMTLKEVRMWHHQRAQTERGKAKKKEGKQDNHSKSLARQHHGRADFHIKCVQALNTVLPHSTVEEDWKRLEDHYAHLPRPPGT